MKPVKRGYKAWVRAHSATGYVFRVEMYTGKQDDDQVEVGLGGRVVKRLCQQPELKQVHVAFDNFFSSSSLMEDLRAREIYTTATVWPNRKGLPLLAKRRAKMERDERKFRSRSNNIVYAQCMDTKHVHVLLTAFSATDVVQVTRRQKDGTSLAVSCPRLIAEYTVRMGGVDRFFQKRECYSVSRRSQKWWLRIFYFFV